MVNLIIGYPRLTKPKKSPNGFAIMRSTALTTQVVIQGKRAMKSFTPIKSRHIIKRTA